MSQYREHTTTFFSTDDDITITSRYGTNTLSTTVAVDGSVETNFKAACWAHWQAFDSLPPSSTAPPCYLTTHGRWIASAEDSTVTSPTATVNVPAGNSGILVVDLDDDSFDTYYRINAGSWVAFSSGGTITVTDGQTLAFKVENLTESYSLGGTVYDQDTEVLVDTLSLMNTEIAP